MSAAPLVIEFICIFIVTCFLIYRYGNVRKQHCLTTVTAFVAWYFSFLIVFIIPLDVTSTLYQQCMHGHHKLKPNATVMNTTDSTASVNSDVTDIDTTTECTLPNSYVQGNVLRYLWRIIYWTSQVLTWLILPIMQSYSNSGHFTVAGKIKSAVIENLIYYATYALIFIICLIYVAVHSDKIDGEKLKVIGITASNTWGLFLLVLLLGYGLVDVPRKAWNNSKQGYRLSQIQFRVARVSTEKTEAEENLEDVFEETRQTAETIRYNHPFRKNLDTILQKCPETFRTSLRNRDDFQEYRESESDLISEKSLIRLHEKVITCIRTNHRMQVQWSLLMEEAFQLENMHHDESSSESQTFQVYEWCTEWWIKCCMQPRVQRVLAVILVVMSVMVVWSECLFFITSPTLSLFALFISGARAVSAYWLIELICIVSISFLCWCAYQSIFQIKILNFYYIAPQHQTDERSLLFVGMMLCRLTPPMCLNFLGLIHLDSHVINKHIEETSYTQIMGHMDVIHIISDGFNIYFPILILLLCVFTYFNLGSRLLHFVGVQQFIGDSDVTQDLVEEGRELIKREWRQRDRLADGNKRRRLWNERFGETPPRPTDRRDKIPSHPAESDRTNLLSEMDPLDYTEESYTNESITTTGEYHHIRSNNIPTKGIFDDI